MVINCLTLKVLIIMMNAQTLNMVIYFTRITKKKMMKKINQKKIQREKIQLSILQFQKKLKMKIQIQLKSLEIREIVLNLKKMKICPKKKVIMKTLRLKATMIVF